MQKTNTNTLNAKICRLNVFVETCVCFWKTKQEKTQREHETYSQRRAPAFSLKRSYDGVTPTRDTSWNNWVCQQRVFLETELLRNYSRP